MKKSIYFIGYFIVLLSLFISCSFLLESCKGKKSSESYSDTEESSFEDDEIYAEYFESDEAASAEGVEVEDVGSSYVDPEDEYTEQDAVEYDEDFSFEASQEEVIQASKTPTPSSSNTGSSSYSSGGNFLVVAGSYLVKDNALNMVDRLKGMGYYDAEIVNFDGSEYHSISAGRYNSYDAASDIASEIKNKGIDCYVHTRK